MVWTVGANRPITEVYEQVKAIAQEVFLPAIEFQQRRKRSASKPAEGSSILPQPSVLRKSLAVNTSADNTLHVVLVISTVAAVALLGAYFFGRKSGSDQ